MRVAFNGTFWDRPRTGSGQYIHHLLASLQTLGEPRVSCSLLLPPSFSGEADTDLAGRPVVARGAHPPLIGGRWGQLDKAMWEFVGVGALARRTDAELLHVPYLSAPVMKRGLRCVVTAHDMIPWVVPGYLGRGAVRLYLWVAARSVSRAHLILADSEASRRDVLRVLRVPPHRVRTVYLGVEKHRPFREEEQVEVGVRFGLPQEYAFYLGGFDRRKNVPLLLAAWKRATEKLGDGACLIIGGSVPPPGGVFPDVVGEAQRLGVAERVRFVGPISEEEKALLMSAARLFVYPSAYEGFGLDPLEAMSVGCPVVSSSGGSLSEVVGEGGLLVPPGDVAALAGAVERVWQDGTLRAELAARGRRQAARFTWEKTAAQTMAAYEALLRSGARGRR